MTAFSIVRQKSKYMANYLAAYLIAIGKDVGDILLDLQNSNANC